MTLNFLPACCSYCEFCILKNSLQILQEYDEIEQKLSYRSDDIEEVMELKHYLAGVQGLITRKDELLQNAMKDYELFERFKYRISDEDFSTKWLAVMGLKKMYKLADDAVTWLEDDYERLLRAQQADLSELSDNVDAVSLSVAGLAANINMDKANEAKTKVDQVWKNIVEVQEQSALLSKRQILFGLPPVQKEAVGRLAQDIQPYKSLWYTCAGKRDGWIPTLSISLAECFLFRVVKYEKGCLQSSNFGLGYASDHENYYIWTENYEKMLQVLWTGWRG